MQAKPYKLTFAITLLIALAVFRLILLVIAYYSMLEINARNNMAMPISEVINFAFILPPIILFFESLIYYFFRKRIFEKKLVLYHVWMAFLTSFILPMLVVIIVLLMPNFLSKSEVIKVNGTIDNQGSTILWILFGITRLLFALAIYRSQTKGEESRNSDFKDYLNEFSNE